MAKSLPRSVRLSPTLHTFFHDHPEVSFGRFTRGILEDRVKPKCVLEIPGPLRVKIDLLELTLESLQVWSDLSARFVYHQEAQVRAVSEVQILQRLG